MAKEALEKKGFELVKFEFTNEELIEIKDVFIGMVSNSFLGPLMKNLDNNYEEPIPALTMSRTILDAGLIKRAFIEFFLKTSGNSRVLSNLKNFRIMT
jgi:hypothetical protein